jgi:hypothetical protein
VLGQGNFETGEVSSYVEDVGVSGFKARGFPGSGFLALFARNATFKRNVADDDGEYGFAAFTSTGTRVLFNWASGSDEAGFYVGDSPDQVVVHVHAVRAFDSHTDAGDRRPLLARRARLGVARDLVEADVKNVPSGATDASGGVVLRTGEGGTAPTDNTVRRNVIRGNQPDISWDGTGSGNVLSPNRCATSVPTHLCN